MFSTQGQGISTRHLEIVHPGGNQSLLDSPQRHRGHRGTTGKRSEIFSPIGESAIEEKQLRGEVML
jgi:hypothetical protein